MPETFILNGCDAELELLCEQLFISQCPSQAVPLTVPVEWKMQISSSTIDSNSGYESASK